MKKNKSKHFDRQTIIALRSQGLSMREIMIKIGAKSTSVIAHHLKQSRLKKVCLIDGNCPVCGSNITA